MLRSLRLKLGLLQPCATKKFARHCTTLRDSKLICCDYIRPRKNFSTKFKRGQNISTKFDHGKTSHLAISYDVNFCEPIYLCCDFVLPKVAVLRLCATQIRYVATLRDSNYVCCDFARPKLGMVRPLQLKMGMLRLCATQRRYVAALRYLKKVCCDPCDSKWVCCGLVRPNYFRDYARP